MIVPIAALSVDVGGQHVETVAGESLMGSLVAAHTKGDTEHTAWWLEVQVPLSKEEHDAIARGIRGE